jgi:hypothetical protein
MVGLEKTLRWMAEKGMLIRMEPRKQKGPGRPPSAIYMIPPFGVTPKDKVVHKKTSTVKKRKTVIHAV